MRCWCCCLCSACIHFYRGKVTGTVTKSGVQIAWCYLYFSIILYVSQNNQRNKYRQLKRKNTAPQYIFFLKRKQHRNRQWNTKKDIAPCNACSINDIHFNIIFKKHSYTRYSALQNDKNGHDNKKSSAKNKDKRKKLDPCCMTLHIIIIIRITVILPTLIFFLLYYQPLWEAFPFFSSIVVVLDIKWVLLWLRKSCIKTRESVCFLPVRPLSSSKLIVLYLLCLSLLKCRHNYFPLIFFCVYRCLL